MKFEYEGYELDTDKVYFNNGITAVVKLVDALLYASVFGEKEVWEQLDDA